VPALALDPAPRHASSYTRLCRTVVTSEGGAALWEAVLEVGQALEDRRPALFVTADHDVLHASEIRDELARYFRFLLPEPETVTTLVDKVAFAGFAEREGLAVPRTFVIDQDADWERVLEEASFPVVVKPKYRTEAWLAAGLAKVFRVEAACDLAGIRALIRSLEANYVVQEWIDGPDENLYTDFGYRSRDGRQLARFTIQKLRQEPPLIGVASLAVPVQHPLVTTEANRLYELCGLKGFGGLEMKLDVRDGKMKLIEPHVRPILPAYLGALIGENVYYRAYCDLTATDPEPEPTAAKPFRWVFLEADLMSYRKARRLGNLDWYGYLREYRRPLVFADLTWRDPLPFLIRIVRLVRRAAGRLFVTVR
jgi:predicted ATP-grasp superfamily ATP-dependent carboligase